MTQKQSMRKIRLISILFLFVCIVAKSQSAEDKTLSPYFVVYSDNPEIDEMPLKETTAKVNVVGVIADVTIRQVYKNSGKNTLEATYVFPMSTKAAVYAMQMSIGNRTITAKIEEKEKARKDYEKAKSEGKRTSLLEQNRPNVFTMNVANIASSDEIVVELKYTELLVPESGVYSFVYPTVVGPRYSNKTKKEASSNDRFVETPYSRSGEKATYKFGLDITINSSIPIQSISCGTHKLQIKHPSLYTAHASIPVSQDTGNRDVIINYSLKGNQIESGVMLYEGKDENFFLIMMQPPKKVLQDEIPPREYIFIVDVSGSMHGFPLDVSKKLLRNLIVNLKPSDRFNVVLFESTAEKLSEKSLEATEANIENAINFIDKKHGWGGTELLSALKEAYSIPRFSENLSRSFVIVTDGYVNVEKETFDFIRNNSGDANFFAFGIGSGVNRHLIEGMAFVGHGEAMVISKAENAMEQAEKFRNYINSPVLTQIRVNYNSFDVYDVEPIAVPDILAERPVVIFGKYKGKAKGSISIQGKTGKKTYKQSFDLSAVKPNSDFSAIRYLWARERIKLLSIQNTQFGWRNHSANNESVKNEVTKLGLKYGLMTEYTSFIAIDNEYRVDGAGNHISVKQPLPLPEGVSNFAVVEDDVDTSLETIAFAAPIMEDEAEEDVIFQITEQMPEFPGGNNNMFTFISGELNYPVIAQENGIQGRVIVQFTVEKDGSITDIVVIRGIDPSLDAEAIRIVKSMPKWKPATQRGKPVRIKYTLPISFRLN